MSCIYSSTGYINGSQTIVGLGITWGICEQCRFLGPTSRVWLVRTKMKPSNIHFKSTSGDSDKIHSLHEVRVHFSDLHVGHTHLKEYSRGSPGTSIYLSHIFKSSFILCFIMHILVTAVHKSLINKYKYTGEVCLIFLLIGCMI